MKPVHILITVSSFADVQLPLQLAEMCRDAGVGFRLSLFLNAPVYQSAVKEMGKIFAQIPNPALRRLREQHIQCFAACHPPQADDQPDLILANTMQDVAQMNGWGATLLLARPEAFMGNRAGFGRILAPFAHLAAIHRANCGMRHGIEYEDLSALACHSREGQVIATCSRSVQGKEQMFAAGTELASQPLSELMAAYDAGSIPGLSLVAAYLRSWKQPLENTVLVVARDGTLQVRPVNIEKGAFQFALE